MRKNVWITLVILFFVALALTFKNNLPVFSFFESQVQHVFTTPKKDLHSITASNSEQTSSRIVELENENKKLVEKLVDYDKLQKDNFALRSQLSNTPVSLSHLLKAEVVGFSGESKNPDSLVISLGKNQNIKKGMTVVYGKNLVGIISKVLAQYAVVTLPTNSRFSVLGKTVQNGTLGIVKGQNHYMDFEQVVITDTLQMGDVVVTRGGVGSDGIGVLPDLVIGKVTSVNRVASSSFQSAQIMSMLQFAKLSTVFIISQ